MNSTLIGAPGRGGPGILSELVLRGRRGAAIARPVDHVGARPGVTAQPVEASGARTMDMRRLMTAAALGATLLCAPAFPVNAQEAVVGVAHPDALFFSNDPKLNRNKQAAYHIVKDLLEANHWELAGKWIGQDYIQHNPQVKNGLQSVVDYFTKTMRLKPTPIPVNMKTELVSVVAEGDKVIVAYVIPIKDSKDPSKTYTTTSFDMWRFKGGKAVEHWDVHTKDD